MLVSRSRDTCLIWVAVRLTLLSVMFVSLSSSFAHFVQLFLPPFHLCPDLHSCTPLSVGKSCKEHTPKCFLYYLCDKKCFLHHKDTERGIKQLQTQLHSREQELILERNLRRQLQRELDNKTNRNSLGGGDDVENVASNFLMHDYAKPYAYFWLRRLHLPWFHEVCPARTAIFKKIFKIFGECFSLK